MSGFPYSDTIHHTGQLWLLPSLKCEDYVSAESLPFQEEDQTTSSQKLKWPGCPLNMLPMDRAMAWPIPSAEVNFKAARVGGGFSLGLKL